MVGSSQMVFGVDGPAWLLGYLRLETNTSTLINYSPSHPPQGLKIARHPLTVFQGLITRTERCHIVLMPLFSANMCAALQLSQLTSTA